MNTLAIGGVAAGQFIKAYGDHDGASTARYSVGRIAAEPLSGLELMQATVEQHRTIYILKKFTYVEANRQERTWWLWVDEKILSSKQPMINLFEHVFANYRAIPE